MIFFVANDGTIIKGMPSPVYQGAANVNDITIIAPFANGLTAAVAFQLPNGVAIPAAPMQYQMELEGIIDKETGSVYSGWTYSLPSDITEYYGTVTAQFYFYAENSNTVMATSSTTFQVAKGVPAVLPTEPSADVYELILNNIASLQKQLNNGAFAARAIYAWNSEYIYGANEITFTPDSGAFGAFVKSIVDNNTQPPYIDGVLNTEYWALVVDFDTISEAFLQSVQEAVSKANDAADMAEEFAQQAEDAANKIGEYADKQIEFVDELPPSGEEGKLYGVVNENGSNLYTLYSYENGEWVNMGSANLVLDFTRTYLVGLPRNGWSGNSQTVSIAGLTAEDAVEVAPVDSSAVEYITSDITASEIVEGGIVFTCNILPAATIAVLVTVTKQQDIPTANGYYTKEEIGALAGTSTELTIDSATYVITLKLKAIDGRLLSSDTIDLPLESVVVNGTYDAETKSIVLTLQNGSTVDIPVGDLVDGLASQTALDAEEAARVSGDTALGGRIDNIVNGTTTVAKAAVADSAASAEKVDNKLTITKNGEPYREYDGSEAVGIDIASSSSQSSSTEEVLAADGWSENRQDIAIAGVTEDNNVSVYPTNASAAAYVQADIMVAQADGKLIFTCTTVPSVSITVVVDISA